jgi:hypothetical protein
MRIEITQERISYSAKAFSPCCQAVSTVNADAQNLGSDPVKPIKAGLVGRDLARSYWRPGEWIKDQDDCLFTQVIAQANLSLKMALQTKIWGDLTDS